MRILFDFEYMGNPIMDTNLLEIMLSIKSQLLIQLTPLIEEIDADDGNIFVNIKPNNLSFQYNNKVNSRLFEKVEPILTAFDWGATVRRFTQTDQN